METRRTRPVFRIQPFLAVGEQHVPRKRPEARVPAILSIPLALPPAEQKVTHASLCGQKRHRQRRANLISGCDRRTSRKERQTSKKPMIYLAWPLAGLGISFRGRERGPFRSFVNVRSNNWRSSARATERGCFCAEIGNGRWIVVTGKTLRFLLNRRSGSYFSLIASL